MPNYTKLFSVIITSSLWTEDDQTRIVWITVMAMSDQNGEVHASVPGLARMAGVPVEACRVALAKFLAPDPDSRSKQFEGRRIAEIDGGWEVLNHGKYRKMASLADKAEKNAERQARYRKRNATVTPSNAPVTLKSDIAEAEAEAEADIPYQKNLPPALQPGVVEGNGNGKLPTTPQSKRIAAIVHRRPTTPWSPDEVKAYKALGIIPEEDMTALDRYYAAEWPPKSGVNILRHDLQTFLNNFPGEVDRAHNFATAKGAKPKPPEAVPADWQTFLETLPIEHRRLWELAPTFLRDDFAKWRKAH